MTLLHLPYPTTIAQVRRETRSAWQELCRGDIGPDEWMRAELALRAAEAVDVRVEEARIERRMLPAEGELVKIRGEK